MRDLFSLGLRVCDCELLVLDQQLLPGQEQWLRVGTPDEMIGVIRALKIRGAPLLGVAGAVSLALHAQAGDGDDNIRIAAAALRSARPTAVNLAVMVDRVLHAGQEGGGELNRDRMVSEAERIFDEDVAFCEAMARNALALIETGDGILTHCNTGGLATAGIGTALGVIRSAHEAGLNIHLFADETRPLLQGGRLTAWECEKFEIPYTILPDGAAADLMRSGKVQKVFLGADRVALNGDFANKVGTYGVAVAASYHGIPFYPVAPFSTIDSCCQRGSQIPIESRAAEEVRGFHGSSGSVCWSPTGAQAYNPAFDVTPVDLVTGLVTDRAYYANIQLKMGILGKEVLQ